MSVFGNVYGNVYGEVYGASSGSPGLGGCISDVPFGLDGPVCGCDDSDVVTATPTIGSLIAARMAEPKSVVVDGVAVTQHSLPDLIALHKYNSGKAAARRGIRFQKITPPGAV